MKIIFLMLPFFLFFISCKKEDGPEPATTSSGNTTPTANPSQCYGIMEATRYKLMSFVSDNTLQDGGSATNIQAQFASQPFVGNGFLAGSLVSAGTVSLNGTTLKLNSSPQLYYTDTTNAITFPVQNWSVSGNTNFGAFTYTDNDSIPVYTGFGQIPDTVYKSNGFAFSVTGMSGADEINLYMYTSSGTVFKTYSSSNTAIVITPSDMSALATGNVIFTLNFSKNNYQLLAGKSYKFRTCYTVQVSNLTLMP